MPRFFFHVFDDAVTRDGDGLELHDQAAAMREGLRSARSLAAEQVLRGRFCVNHRIEIKDEAGASLGIISFMDAVSIER